MAQDIRLKKLALQDRNNMELLLVTKTISTKGENVIVILEEVFGIKAKERVDTPIKTYQYMRSGRTAASESDGCDQCTIF